MDHTLSLSRQSSAPPRPAEAGVTPTPAAVGPVEEEPESPGRSPRGSIHAAPVSDPLTDGLLLLAGIGIGLLAVLVPLATVICEPRAPLQDRVMRAGG